eukprot:10532406-Heterocapsa_arctica.AAC.1
MPLAILALALPLVRPRLSPRGPRAVGLRALLGAVLGVQAARALVLAVGLPGAGKRVRVSFPAGSRLERQAQLVARAVGGVVAVLAD